MTVPKGDGVLLQRDSNSGSPRHGFFVGPKGVVIRPLANRRIRIMFKSKSVHVSQLLPEPRKRRWWKPSKEGLLKLFNATLKLLGMILKLLNLLGGIAKVVKKLIEFWPG
jgi:hypothetical protein